MKHGHTSQISPVCNNITEYYANQFILFQYEKKLKWRHCQFMS